MNNKAIEAAAEADLLGHYSEGGGDMVDRDCHHGQLARSCGLCEVEADIAEMQATIARQREWIQAAGHKKECRGPRVCGKCGHVLWANLHAADKPEYTHDFIVGPCSCGWAELVGG